MKEYQVKNLRMLLYGFGAACLIANTVILYVTFVWAYFFNDFVFRANINKLGEAPSELIILTISIIVGFYTIFSFFKILPRSANN